MASNLYRFSPKDPATSNDPFTFDLTAWLGANWTITGSPTATVSPSGLTLGTVVSLGGLVTVYVSGGTVGTDYTLTIHVSAVDANSNTRGPVAIGAMVLCITPVPAL